jgi:hypothetical protein
MPAKRTQLQLGKHALDDDYAALAAIHGCWRRAADGEVSRSEADDHGSFLRRSRKEVLAGLLGVEAFSGLCETGVEQLTTSPGTAGGGGRNRRRAPAAEARANFNGLNESLAARGMVPFGKCAMAAGSPL